MSSCIKQTKLQPFTIPGGEMVLGEGELGNNYFILNPNFLVANVV